MNQLVSLLPVVVGSLLTGLTSFISIKFQDGRTTAQHNKEALRGCFSNVLDALYDVRDNLLNLGLSQSGRQSEFTATTDEQLQESRDRDNAGVASMNLISEAFDRAGRSAVHMRIYASEPVIQAYRTLENDFREDMLAVLDESTESNKFSAARFNALMASFDTNLDRLALAMKDNLDHPERTKRLKSIVHWLA
ncbi:MAG: hypothetical protein UHI81_02950 [Olegusella sp.]|nr:hypothetical protein [Olegusella sp.]